MSTLSRPAVAVPRADRKLPWDALMLSVAAMILAYVWRIQDLFGILGVVRLPVLALAVAIVAFVATGDPRRRVGKIRHPVVTLLVVIFAIMALSVPAGLYPGRSFAFIRDDHVKTLFLFVLVAASVRSFADVERYAGVLVAGAAVYSWFILTRFQIGPGGRLSNLIYYDANDIALLLVSTLPITVYFLNRTRKAGVRVLLLIVLGLFIMGIVRSGSRGGFLGLIAVVAYLLFGFGAIPKKVRVFSVAASLLLLTVVASDKYWEMMGTLLNPQEDYNWSNDKGSGRTEIWKRGVGYMISNPVLGVGTRNFPIAEARSEISRERASVGRGFKYSAAHNSFVEIGAELGVFALIAFVAVLWRAFQTARRGGYPAKTRGPPPRSRLVSREIALGHALAGSIIGYVVSGFFLSQAYSAYLYVLFGIIVGLAKVAREAGQHPAVGPVPQPGRRATVRDEWGRGRAVPRPGVAVPAHARAHRM